MRVKQSKPFLKEFWRAWKELEDAQNGLENTARMSVVAACSVRAPSISQKLSLGRSECTCKVLASSCPILMPRSRSEALAEERKKVHEKTEIVCLLRCQSLHERSNMTDRLRFEGTASFMTRPVSQALSSRERVAQSNCVVLSS